MHRKPQVFRRIVDGNQISEAWIGLDAIAGGVANTMPAVAKRSMMPLMAWRRSSDGRIGQRGLGHVVRDGEFAVEGPLSITFRATSTSVMPSSLACSAPLPRSLVATAKYGSALSRSGSSWAHGDSDQPPAAKPG
jgi:hypothetical protein